MRPYLGEPIVLTQCLPCADPVPSSSPLTCAALSLPALGGAPVEELRHLAQANVSMDIDTFTNLNPHVLQVGEVCRVLRFQPSWARGACEGVPVLLQALPWCLLPAETIPTVPRSPAGRQEPSGSTDGHCPMGGHGPVGDKAPGRYDPRAETTSGGHGS